MNIEKIKNYNQKMLAVFCSLGILLLLLGVIALIIEIWPRNYHYNEPQGLISEEKTESLNQENLRKQVISYQTPWLIDTLKSIYIVPVEINTLKKSESTEFITEKIVIDSYESLSGNYKKGYYKHSYFEGTYANLIVYSPKEHKTHALFNERIIIGNVQVYYFKDDILMIFYGATKDTDKNGIIDLEDHKNLIIYSINTGLIKKVIDGENQAVEYSFVENSKDLLIKYHLSQYQKSQFDYMHLPSKIMKHSYETGQIENIIPDQMQQEIQKTVEGKIRN